MDAKELRLGNITNKGKVTALPMGCQHSKWQISCDYCDYNFNQVKPISLTVDWLIRFGFKLDFWKSEYINYPLSYEIESGKIYLFDSRLKDDEYCLQYKYVHQLQNLYFALTGEELNLKN